jgi:hypothetical protein
MGQEGEVGWLQNHVRSAETSPTARPWGMRMTSTATFVKFGSRLARPPTLLRAQTLRPCLATFASEWPGVPGPESIAATCKSWCRKHEVSDPVVGFNESVIQALREQGFDIHESVMSTEGMIYGVRSSVASAWVKGGDELADLAAGRITLAEIAVRQPKQKPKPETQ